MNKLKVFTIIFLFFIIYQSNSLAYNLEMKQELTIQNQIQHKNIRNTILISTTSDQRRGFGMGESTFGQGSITPGQQSQILKSMVNPDDYAPSENVEAEEFKKIGNAVFGVVQAVGSVISVGSLIFMGIKYMASSIEEKASYKKTIIPYIIGAVLLFATSNIVGAIYSVVTNWT